MADRASSDNPLVQAQLDRLAGLSPGRDILGLERISALLARLGNPERALPPVFHVAGTNGKGSTCAFLRAALEAAGLKVHAYTSPHLVRFNERIRLAGRLIEDEALAEVLAEVFEAAGEMELSFFEATTAAAFLAFARTPANAAVIEVGLGGRLDATNVIETPLVCGIGPLGHDHHAFLGDTLEAIAGEKAGIAKAGAPLITLSYQESLKAVIRDRVEAAGATWLPIGGDWHAGWHGKGFRYRDRNGSVELPMPRLTGEHQAVNAGLAVAMLRHQNRLAIPDSALRAAMGWAEWPARLQLLAPGPLRDLLPAEAELWLDGAHNPAAARAVADHFRMTLPPRRPFHMIFGLLANKDAPGVLHPFRGRDLTVHTIPVPGHEHHSPEALAAAAREAGLAAMPAASVEDALGWIARHADRDHPPIVLIMGSLYLAGTVLQANGELPT